MHLEGLSRLACVIALALMIAATPASVAAQEPDARHVSLGVAAGVAIPLHGDFDFTAAAWQLDVRFNIARHLASTVFFEQWQHTDEDVLTNQPGTGPTVSSGHIDLVTVRTVNRTRAAGWSVLAKGASGRVTFSGGGGVSYLLYSRDFSETFSGCTSANLCSDFSDEFDNSAFAAQVQAGVDVALARHIAVMGHFRLLVPVEDPGSGHHTILGGLRVLF
jgi:hypothetical protein